MVRHRCRQQACRIVASRPAKQASVALNYFAYNFVRIHRTLRMSPAMAAGVTTRLWDVSDIIAILEAKERVQAA